MLSRLVKDKSILANLIEQGIRILLIKECKKIGNLKISVIASSTEMIKGEIQKINISAEDVYYKDILFDDFKIEANHLKINFKLKNRKFNFTNNPIIKFKISLSQKTLRTVLLSKSWNWIKNMISKGILNQRELEDIKINNDQLLMIFSKDNIAVNQAEHINIKTEKGKVYLENKSYKKKIIIPIEDKIYIENVNIENNLINISASSYVSF